MRESKGMCANYEPQSISRLVFGLNSALGSLVMTVSALSLRLFGQKPMGRRALFGYINLTFQVSAPITLFYPNKGPHQ